MGRVDIKKIQNPPRQAGVGLLMSKPLFNHNRNKRYSLSSVSSLLEGMNNKIKVIKRMA